MLLLCRYTSTFTRAVRERSFVDTPADSMYFGRPTLHQRKKKGQSLQDFWTGPNKNLLTDRFGAGVYHTCGISAVCTCPHTWHLVPVYVLQYSHTHTPRTYRFLLERSHTAPPFSTKKTTVVHTASGTCYRQRAALLIVVSTAAVTGAKGE